MDTIITKPHKVQPSRYALHLLRLWTRRNAWWAFGVPIVIALILAMFVDTKFVFLAVVLVCLVLPHVMVSVYWRHLLSDRTCRWLLLHRLTATADGITVDYEREPSDAEEEADDTTTEQKPLRSSFTIARSDISGAKIAEGEIVLNIGDDPYHIVIVPMSVFDDAASRSAFLRLFE